MSILSTVTDFIFGTPMNTTFSIYTNDVTSLDPASTPAITFGSLYDFMYTKEVAIAYEPLENSQFSSDSIQYKPYTLAITAIYAPTANDGVNDNDSMRNSINAVVEQIKKYQNNTTLLTILQTRPLFDLFQNLKITTFNYELTNQNTVLYARLIFQEIRTTSTSYGGLQQDTVANPQSATSVDNGNVQPFTPTDTALLGLKN